MIKLRPYQEKTVEYLYSLYKNKSANSPSPCIVAPTGAGKTVIFCELIKRITQEGGKPLVMANRQELIFQPQAKLLNLAAELEFPQLRPNVIMGNTPQFVNRGVWIASVQTLKNRVLPDADIVIIDEAHLSASAKWEEMVKEYKKKGAFVVGFTATPQRLDGKPLASLYTEIQSCGTVKNLTKMGFLVPVRYKYKMVSLEAIKQKGADYDTEQMYKDIYKSGKIHDGIIEDYMEHVGDQKSLIFCCNIEHANQIAEELRKQGVVARSLTSKDTSQYRKDLLRKFADGEIDAIANCGVLTTGYDCPGVQCVVLARATQSLTLYMQMVGRGTRPSENKDHLLLLDFGNNVARHGRIDIDRNWSLDGKKKREKLVVATKICPAILEDGERCMQVCEVDADVCDFCGTPFGNTLIDMANAELLMEKKRKIQVIKGGEMVSEDDPLWLELQKTRLTQVPTEFLEKAVEVKGYKRGAAFMERKRRGELTSKEQFNELMKEYVAVYKLDKNIAYSHVYKLCGKQLGVNFYALQGKEKSVLGRIDEHDKNHGTEYIGSMCKIIKQKLLTKQKEQNEEKSKLPI